MAGLFFCRFLGCMHLQVRQQRQMVRADVLKALKASHAQSPRHQHMIDRIAE